MENNIENNMENNNKLNLGSQNMVEDKMLNEISGGQKTFFDKHWKEISAAVSVVGTIALGAIVVAGYRGIKNWQSKKRLPSSPEGQLGVAYPELIPGPVTGPVTGPVVPPAPSRPAPPPPSGPPSGPVLGTGPT